MTPKARLLVTTLSVMCLVSLIASAYYGYQYFKERAEYVRYRSAMEKIIDGEVPEVPVFAGEDTSSPVVPSGYLYQEVVCVENIGEAEASTSRTLYLIYPSVTDVEFKNVSTDCEGVEMKYRDSTLIVSTVVDDGSLKLFDEGVEAVRIKTGTVENTSSVLRLGREKFVQRVEEGSESTEYRLNYVSLGSDEECISLSGDEEVRPCYRNGNPFLNPGGSFVLHIPLDKSTEEILEVVDFFDKVASNSYFVEVGE